MTSVSSIKQIKQQSLSPNNSRSMTPNRNMTRPASSSLKVNSPDKTLKQLHLENQQLKFKIDARDNEIERMKIQMFALHEKVAMVDDLQQNVQDHQGFLVEEQEKRNQLQVHIVELVEKIDSDTVQHEQRHSKSLKEIENLRQQLHQLSDDKLNMERELLKDADEAKAKQAAEMQLKDRTMAEQEVRHNRVLENLQREQMLAIQQLQQENADLLKQRDEKHFAQLTFMDKEKTQREKEFLAKSKLQLDESNKDIQNLQQEMKEKLARAEQYIKMLQDDIRQKQKKYDCDLANAKDTQQTQLELHQQQLREQQERHEQEQKHAQQRHDEQLSYLNEKYEKDKKLNQERHDSERTAQQERHDRERKDALQRHDKEVKLMRERHEKETLDSQERNKMELERLNQQIVEWQERYDSDIRNLHNEIREKSLLHEAEFKEAQSKYDSEIRRLTIEGKNSNDTADAALKRTQELHQAELKKFREEQAILDQAHRDEVKQVQANHAQALKNLEDQHRHREMEREEYRSKEIFQQIIKFDEMQKRMKQDQENLRTEKDQQIMLLKQVMQNTKSKDDEQIFKLKTQIEIDEQQNLVLQSKILALSEELELKNDIESQLEEVQQRLNVNQLARENLLREIEKGTEMNFKLEEKVYASNQNSLELLKQIKNQEEEIETLQHYIMELKSRLTLYIPVRTDTIDESLANYINNYPERAKLKIMFMRQRQGVYQFGSKRVTIKVERQKILVKVGGGYISIDQFLDQYTQLELEKLYQNGPLKKFNTKPGNKMAVNSDVNDASPVNITLTPKAAMINTEAEMEEPSREEGACKTFNQYYRVTGDQAASSKRVRLSNDRQNSILKPKKGSNLRKSDYMTNMTSGKQIGPSKSEKMLTMKTSSSSRNASQLKNGLYPAKSIQSANRARAPSNMSKVSRQRSTTMKQPSYINKPVTPPSQVMNNQLYSDNNVMPGSHQMVIEHQLNEPTSPYGMTQENNYIQPDPLSNTIQPNNTMESQNVGSKEQTNMSKLSITMSNRSDQISDEQQFEAQSQSGEDDYPNNMM